MSEKWIDISYPTDETLDDNIVIRIQTEDGRWKTADAEDKAKMLAAPELLEALEFMYEQITNEKNASHTLGAYTHGAGIDMARKAIAKAKGE
jgi:hypothetical protein